MKRKSLFIFAGFGLLLLSFYLAFFLRFNHFYEFLLTGLFLILLPFTIKHLSSIKLFVLLYLSFVALGLFIDLLIGISLFKLWHYSYSNLFEYFLLYALIYPLGGFVLLESFLLGRTFAEEKTNYTGDLKTKLVVLSVVLLALIILLIVTKTFFAFSAWAAILTICIIVFGIVSTNAASEFLSAKSYARELFSNPRNVISITLVATYFNAFLHEYPNLFANQWIYTAYINPFFDTHFLGIPLLIWLIWSTLLIGPASIYYFWKPII